MNLKLAIHSIRKSDVFTGLAIALLVVIGTFPENDWSYSIGIDPSLVWVFNHLFETGLDAGRHIIFPHGPLAFFMYPLSNNILTATLISALLKGLLVFNVFLVSTKNNQRAAWLLAFSFAYLVSILASFNHLILANLILLYCNHWLSKHNAFKYLAFFMTAFAFYVKAYVAIVSGTLFFSFVLYHFIRNKNLKAVLIDGAVLLGFVLLFWLFMYGTFNGFLSYVWGMVNLAQDNSSAAAYYPHNNWVILSLFFLAVASVFLVGKSQKTTFFSVLIALGLFASWKHGMAREDIYHSNGLLIFLIISLTSFLLFEPRRPGIRIIFVVLALFLFSVNQRHVINYSPYKYQLFRANNFVEFVSNFDQLKEKSDKKSAQQTASKKLPESIRNTIEDTAVDIYPWDYSIAGVNNLNWQPRVVIQSYAAYTSWLDHKNANYFATENAPEFLLWDKDIGIVDINNCGFNSLDNRYLLNDEPKTILQLISMYRPALSEGKFSLYQKRETPVPYDEKPIGNNKTTWGEWIEVPSFDRELLRARLNFSKNLSQKLKSFLYKDEQFWMYLKLADGSIHKFRIVPKNARDGLWINPYVFGDGKFYSVKKIMFKASNQEMLSPQLQVDWTETGFTDEPDLIGDFFGLNHKLKDTLLYSSTHGFEQNTVANWSKTGEAVLSDKAFSGNQSHILADNPFSATFSMDLDSIPHGNLYLTADAWINSPSYKQANNISLVITIERKGSTGIYQRIAIDEQLIDSKQWNHISSKIPYHHSAANSRLVVYFWNTGKAALWIDNFRVEIHTQK